MGTILKIENLKKQYGDKQIVKGISLEVEEGEFLTFLGPSGCGKTTILRCISGLEEVNSGKIYIYDKDVTDLDPTKREVNTIFQSYALFSHMTVEQNVAFGLKMKRVPKKEIAKRVKEMLKLVKLDGYEKRKPYQLSGGEQQRVAIARALINKPKVLLLDEPLSALDRKLQKQMEIELKRLQKKMGITFIYVTHNQDEALTMSDRICILRNAKIEQCDTPENIYKHPKTLFVAQFIGESNIFKGKIKSTTKDRASLEISKDLVLDVPNHDYKYGDKICLIIRPEDFIIRERKSKNTITVTVKESIYDGSITKFICDYNGEQVSFTMDSSSKKYAPETVLNLSCAEKDLILIKEGK